MMLTNINFVNHTYLLHSSPILDSFQATLIAHHDPHKNLITLPNDYFFLELLILML